MTEKEFDKDIQYYVNKGKKIEDMRDDIRLRPLAVQLGYTPQYGKNFADGLSFNKDKKHIWECSRGWACADIPFDTYENHRYYEELEEALRKEA